MIVNVLDTLERWTNAKLTGGVHRVSIPEGIRDENGVTLNERFSMAYLFKAERNVSVGPLEQFMNFDKANFPSITALEFQKWRNNTLYT
jgi:isopenicillin N synthase-like dioxygenase